LWAAVGERLAPSNHFHGLSARSSCRQMNGYDDVLTNVIELPKRYDGRKRQRSPRGAESVWTFAPLDFVGGEMHEFRCAFSAHLNVELLFCELALDARVVRGSFRRAAYVTFDFTAGIWRECRYDSHDYCLAATELKEIRNLDQLLQFACDAWHIAGLEKIRLHLPKYGQMEAF